MPALPYRVRCCVCSRQRRLPLISLITKIAQQIQLGTQQIWIQHIYMNRNLQKYLILQTLQGSLVWQPDYKLPFPFSKLLNISILPGPRLCVVLFFVRVHLFHATLKSLERSETFTFAKICLYAIHIFRFSPLFPIASRANKATRRC